jgi:hypothetical protein
MFGRAELGEPRFADRVPPAWVGDAARDDLVVTGEALTRSGLAWPTLQPGAAVDQQGLGEHPGKLVAAIGAGLAAIAPALGHLGDLRHRRLDRRGPEDELGQVQPVRVQGASIESWSDPVRHDGCVGALCRLSSLQSDTAQVVDLADLADVNRVGPPAGDRYNARVDEF